MRIKKYVGSTVSEALGKVKDDLGAEAVILNTRTERRGSSGERAVEVTAALDDDPAIREHPSPFGLAPSSKIAEADLIDRLVDGIDEVKESVRSLVESYRCNYGLPGKLPGLVHSLLDNEVEESIIKAHIHRLLNDLRGREFDDRRLIEKKVIDAFERMIGTGRGIKLEEGRTTVVCFAGPSGSGKTTTIAKVAADFALSKGVPVSIITTDTKRVAAVSQLKSYTEIMGISLGIVYTPGEIKDAIRSGDSELILIDTTSTSPYDEAGLEELATLIGEAEPDEIHIVLSATTGFRSMIETIHAFKLVPVTGLLFTKLDEAKRCGTILSAAVWAKKSISYITTGRSVPGDIEVADVEKLACWAVGRNSK